MFAGLAAAGIMVAGCDSSTTVSSQDISLFKNSTPEIQQLFATARAADQQNNYLSACTNYQALMGQKLSVDQSMAMQTVMKSLMERIYAAADKGNAGAKDALKYLQSRQPH